MGYALPYLISTVVYAGCLPYLFKYVSLVKKEPNPVELQSVSAASSVQQPLNPSSLSMLSSNNP